MSLFPKKSKDQVKVFRLIDALTFGMVALLSNVLIGYGLVAGENLGTREYVLLPIIMLLFWWPYVMFLFARAKWVKRISFITKHGLPVMTNGYPITQKEVEDITDETIAKWDAALNWDKSAEAVQTLFVNFKPYPLTEPRNLSRKYAGLLRNKWALVGYKQGMSVKHTALAHELGHEIHFAFTGRYDNEGCHKFMIDHRLP